MRYAIVDQEGASRGHFEAFSDLLEVIDEISSDDVTMVGEFCVLRYDDEGIRVGDPIGALTLLPKAASDMAAVTISSGEAKAYGSSAGSWHLQSSGPLQAA